jgi:nucleoid-associated protein YgaU
VIKPTVVKPPDPAPLPRNGRVYIVRPGDTLGRIAGREYGDPFRSPEIFNANSGITNPDLIYVDQAIVIP